MHVQVHTNVMPIGASIHQTQNIIPSESQKQFSFYNH